MTKICFAICILIIQSACSPTSKNDCKKFHKGSFFSHYGLGQYTIIERDDSTQIETNKITGGVMRAKIKWTNDCEYQLTNFEESKDSSDSLKPTWTGKVFTTKILQVHANYCVYESSLSDVSMRMIDTLRILQ